MSSARNWELCSSPLPMVIFPASCSLLRRRSSLVFSERETISSARRRRSMPSSVRVMRCLPRWNSFTPSSSSSCISWRDRVGWVRCSSSAALVMFSSRATIKKYFKTRISMGTTPFLCIIPHAGTFFNSRGTTKCLPRIFENAAEVLDIVPQKGYTKL